MAEWTVAMSTGVPLLDLQHQALISRLNELVAAMAGGAGKEKLPELLEFLAQYVDEHFADEEREMDARGCILAPTNKRAHMEFTRRFVALRESVAQTGPTTVALLQTATELRDWLINHIQGCDAHLRDYV